MGVADVLSTGAPNKEKHDMISLDVTGYRRLSEEKRATIDAWLEEHELSKYVFLIEASGGEDPTYKISRYKTNDEGNRYVDPTDRTRAAQETIEIVARRPLPL